MKKHNPHRGSSFSEFLKEELKDPGFRREFEKATAEILIGQTVRLHQNVAAEREQLMQGIYDGVKAGNYPLARQRFEAVSSALQERYGVSTLIMGCTEIPLALAEHPRLEGLSLVNPSVVLASALARHAYWHIHPAG